MVERLGCEMVAHITHSAGRRKQRYDRMESEAFEPLAPTQKDLLTDDLGKGVSCAPTRRPGRDPLSGRPNAMLEMGR
jgi:hypothetical protein